MHRSYIKAAGQLPVAAEWVAGLSRQERRVLTRKQRASQAQRLEQNRTPVLPFTLHAVHLPGSVYLPPRGAIAWSLLGTVRTGR